MYMPPKPEPKRIETPVTLYSITTRLRTLTARTAIQLMDRWIDNLSYKSYLQYIYIFIHTYVNVHTPSRVLYGAIDREQIGDIPLLRVNAFSIQKSNLNETAANKNNIKIIFMFSIEIITLKTNSSSTDQSQAYTLQFMITFCHVHR